MYDRMYSLLLLVSESVLRYCIWFHIGDRGIDPFASAKWTNVFDPGNF